MSDKFKELINSDFGKISKDILEIPLDSFIENETLKKIPIFGTIVNLYNLGSTINDKIFANKLIHFLKELEGINPDIIQREIQYIDDSKEYKHKVGEKILEIINRIDSEEKPKIIGRLFKNFLLKNINYKEFLKLSDIIEKIFYYDLLSIMKFNESLYLHSEEIFRTIDNMDANLEILNNGLCEDRYKDSTPDIIISKSYQITYIGNLLIDYGLKQQ